MLNLAVILRESATSRPKAPALLHDGGTITYGELDARSDAVAAALQARGIGPGDPVALQAPNIPEFPVAYFGILKTGAVVVPLNVLLRAPEVAHQLRDSGARILITWAAVADEAARAAAEAAVPDVYVINAAADSPGRPFTDLTVPVAGPFPLAERSPGDVAAIVYTSGTTGLPKGAELTHFQMYMNADIPGRLFEIKAEDVVLTVLPLFHVYGMSSAMNLGIRFGCALSLVPRFTPEKVLAAIERDRATIFDGVPTMFGALVAYAEDHECDTSSLRVCVSGGDAIPAHVFDAFEQRFHVPILEGYGMTETASTITFNPSPDDRRPYSVGKPVWGVEVQVWDSEGRRMPPGRNHVGEFVTRGYQTMRAYHGHPSATAEAFEGGWFHTGDLGYADADGFLFIVDRKKELIIRGGYNVYPREVEEILYHHPGVREAAVVGVPDERLGQEVKAIIVTRPGHTLTAGEIVEYCRERVAAYKYPRLVEFRDALPLTGTGKVLKKDLV
ncbi:long-chain-fatty-acid--CoA ligase [Paractinoplanes brasiliensis]|uniref:Long-chain acyl-CoA synthetase n=1 Tax=Paractinoplanes brasiliensis TaxID=52695 RepID=A0A4R6JLM1_9ACTN|nr:long-chain fatty acid--CoA ligase [Actinoplanes brasiliensis]TDO36707.1 long-chain acyl-CoA synthetase [Actinoplanes brasiliensis]GID32344.1 long-chain-fatty-acid--CoA ligase [Actinoplanes brasiliensis]